jgi:hypothetical protein
MTYAYETLNEAFITLFYKNKLKYWLIENKFFRVIYL